MCRLVAILLVMIVPLACMADSSYHLVEALAGRIAEMILAEFEVRCVQVLVNKPGAIRNAKDVGVKIRRNRDD